MRLEILLFGCVLFFTAVASRAHAESVGSTSTTFDLSGSTGNSTDSAGNTSDSTKPAPEPNKARKLVVPMRVRDEAALFMISETGLQPSALLRSTIQAFRRLLQSEGACKKKCSDTEVVYLLLKRTETPRG